MYEEMNQLEFKYHLLVQLANYKELKEIISKGDTEKALNKLEELIEVINESLGKN